jgi:methylated-DNA-[protein]-cysteine S-methyltransferase
MAAYFDTLQTPVGEVLVAVDEAGDVLRVHFLSGGSFGDAVGPLGYLRRDPVLAGPAREQLVQYFAGSRRQFDLRPAPAGTSFQQAVWSALRAIPYGQTVSYGEIASRLGQRSACRAVGAANGANPVPIIIPCHRVVGSHGELVGFGAGLPVKRFLLRLEGVFLPEQRELEL